MSNASVRISPLLLATGNIITSRSMIWSRNFFRDFANVVKQSQVSEASQYWWGSRAQLKALEVLVFLTLKYAFSTFPGTFSSNYFMYLYVRKL